MIDKADVKFVLLKLLVWLGPFAVAVALTLILVVKSGLPLPALTLIGVVLGFIAQKAGEALDALVF